MAHTIILGYDGSECAKEALDAAVGFARDQPGSKVIAVYGCYGAVHTSKLVAGEFNDLKAHVEATVQVMLEEAKARIAAAGVAAESVLEWNTAAGILLHVAEEKGADMIVIGTHGTGAVHGLLLGSTPHKLLHRTHLPVVVVPHRH